MPPYGSKRGYCFNDDTCNGGKTPVYTSCTFQGLSVRCVDDYEPFLDCQYLDVTDVPNVTTRAFVLRVTVDTADLLPDPDRSNNVTEVTIPGCGDGIVQPGEACDPGPGGVAPCCDATCQLVAAGTTCRPAAGPCDAAEACDGNSAECPADARKPDGASCDAGAPPCFTARCRSGTCESSVAAGSCFIAGQCAASGAAEPGNACQLCDPTRATDAWSPDVRPDETGVRCQVDRVTSAVQAACRPRVVRSLAVPLRQLGQAVTRDLRAVVSGQTASGASVRLARRLARAVKSAGTRRRCDVQAASQQIGVLEAQLTLMTARQQ